MDECLSKFGKHVNTGLDWVLGFYAVINRGEVVTRCYFQHKNNVCQRRDANTQPTFFWAQLVAGC